MATTLETNRFPSVTLDGDDTGPYTLYWWCTGAELVAPTETVGHGETTAIEVETTLLGGPGCPMIPFAIGGHGMVSETYPSPDHNLSWTVASQVEIQDTNAPVDRGETLEVDADVENEGTETHEVELVLVVEDDTSDDTDGFDEDDGSGRVDTRVVDSTTVELEPGESRTEEFTYDTSDEDREAFDVTVRASTGSESPPDGDVTAVEVDQPGDDGSHDGQGTEPDDEETDEEAASDEDG